MQQNTKVQIYQGMIQYLLESTHYTLKNIADLSNSSIKNIRSIHCDGLIPPVFASELQLVKLYHIVLEVNINKNVIARPSVFASAAKQSSGLMRCSCKDAGLLRLRLAKTEG